MLHCKNQKKGGKYSAVFSSIRVSMEDYFPRICGSVGNDFRGIIEEKGYSCFYDQEEKIFHCDSCNFIHLDECNRMKDAVRNAKKRKEFAVFLFLLSSYYFKEKRSKMGFSTRKRRKILRKI